MLKQLLTNPFVYIPFITWVIAQVIKFGIHLFYGRFDLKYLVASGGMPSAHAAVVTSLATTAFVNEGAGSPLFGALLVIAGIVIYDSFGVRRASGEQAVVLNRLIEDLSKRREVGSNYTHMREWLGHRPEEVLVGSVLGTLLAFAAHNYDMFGSYLSFAFLFTVPAEFPLLEPFLLCFGSLLVIAVLIKGWVITQKVNKAKKAMLNKFFWVMFLGGVVGVLYSWFAYEGISIVSFPFFFLVFVAVWLFFVRRVVKFYRHEYAKEKTKAEEEARKAKYL